MVVVTLMAAAVSCDGDDDGGAAGPTTTGEDVTTSTTAGPTTTTTGPTTTPGMDLVRCSNPDFSVGYPRSWVERTCSQFHRQPFESRGATDDRVAAITAYVDPVPFAVATDPEGVQNLERTELEIDSRPAARLSYQTGGDGLYPPGTPVTFFAVDLPAGPEGQARTLFLDTVGLSGFAYEENVEVLNRMASTVDITGS